jgi:hypothetical protein
MEVTTEVAALPKIVHCEIMSRQELQAAMGLKNANYLSTLLRVVPGKSLAVTHLLKPVPPLKNHPMKPVNGIGNFTITIIRW